MVPRLTDDWLFLVLFRLSPPPVGRTASGKFPLQKAAKDKRERGVWISGRTGNASPGQELNRRRGSRGCPGLALRWIQGMDSGWLSGCFKRERQWIKNPVGGLSYRSRKRLGLGAWVNKLAPQISL